MALPASPLQATSPEPYLDVLPLVSSQGGTPGEVALSLKREGLQEIDIQSTIIGEGGPISSAKTAGASLLDPNTVPVEDRISLAPGYVLAGKGDTVRFAPLHALSLPPGVYEERILITIIRNGAQYPIDMLESRFFEVTDRGIAPLTPEEFSRRVEKVFTDDTGRRFYMGTGGPPNSVEVPPSSGLVPNRNCTPHKTPNPTAQ